MMVFIHCSLPACLLVVVVAIPLAGPDRDGARNVEWENGSPHDLAQVWKVLVKVFLRGCVPW